MVLYYEDGPRTLVAAVDAVLAVCGGAPPLVKGAPVAAAVRARNHMFACHLVDGIRYADEKMA